MAAEEPRLFRELDAALREHIQRGGQTPWQPPGPEAGNRDAALSPAPSH